MKNLRGLSYAAIAVIALVAAGIHFASAAPTTDYAVRIANNAFSPSTVTVPVGSTVTWTNYDSYAHTVTASAKGGFDSGSLDSGKSYTQTFSKTGTYKYACSIHPSMTGTVVVISASPSPTSTGY